MRGGLFFILTLILGLVACGGPEPACQGDACGPVAEGEQAPVGTQVDLPPAERCGDGMVRAGVEECDDGNAEDGDGCTGACVAARCGDGLVRAGVEECDDGNVDDTDACTAACAIARCGDGIVRTGVEECDDGDGSDVDQCTTNCTVARC